MPRPPSARRLVLFTKPAVPGRVKTRLVGEGPRGVSPEQAAELHRAFLDDVAERLLAAEARGELAVWSAWALDGPGEEAPEALPEGPGRPLRQVGATLGDRMFHALSQAAGDGAVAATDDETGAAVAATDETGAAVAALGSDHPTVATETIVDAFERLEAGADLVIGPSDDGGYFLIALAPGAVRRELFDGVTWSTGAVLEETLERARRLGLRFELLPAGYDVDRPDDLRRLAAELAGLTEEAVAALCPRTRALLAAWGWLDRCEAAGSFAAVGAPAAAEAGR